LTAERFIEAAKIEIDMRILREVQNAELVAHGAHYYNSY